MNKKVGITFAVLLGLVAASSFISDFHVVPGRDLPIYLCIILSIGMWMLFYDKLSVWLKLFLLSVLLNPIYAMNPVEAGVCSVGIVFFYLAYIFLINFNSFDMVQLVKLLPILCLVQALWVFKEGLYFGRWYPLSLTDSSLVGTIGYSNLTGLLLVSLLPLVILYYKKAWIFVLIALIPTRSIFTYAILLFTGVITACRKYVVVLVIGLAVIAVLVAPIAISRFLYPTGRFDIWKTCIGEIKKRPLVGTGLGSFKVLKHPIEKEKGGFYPVLEPTPYSLDVPGMGECEVVRTFHPHNTFLRVWREGGIFPALFILIFIGSTIVDFLRSKKTDVQTAIFASLCGFHIGAAFSFPERSIGIVAIWIVLVAANRVLVRRG